MIKKIIIKTIEGQPVVYASAYYYLELSTAQMLKKNLNIKYEVSLREAERQIQRIEAEEKIDLDEMQKTAVVEAARNRRARNYRRTGYGKNNNNQYDDSFFRK